MKPKTITKSKAKKKAWKEFSTYIRLKHADELGNVLCYTCSKLMPWNESQAGHGISGRLNAVLFMEEVVRPQCRGCNIFARGRQSIFTMKLIEEMGMRKYKLLVEEANQTVQYKVNDYIELARFFKEQHEKLLS